MSDLADTIIACVASVGIAFGLIYTAYEMRGPEVIVKRVETCSPRSVDNYSPTELRRIAGARERMGRIK